ncbi:hypothetical protein GRJ2_003482900 [Grus japonensis]|uniref:ribonuclease H n=1 Tax=Grus japonensis TaxID=30415 RepID=A0ABC9YJT9_GRUJA
MLELQYELESKAAKWYATIDIANAFFSIPLAAECRPQFAFTWRGVQYTWNRLPQGWKHSPTISHGLIQTALEKGGAPEHLQCIDDIIVWGNKAEEVFEKGKRVIQILLKAGFAIKKSKVKGPAQEIQFLGIKWQDGRRHVPMDVVNKIATVSPPANKKETQAFLGLVGFWRMHIPGNHRKWKAAVWSPTRQVVEATEGEGESSQFAEVKAIQLALKIAEREKWPVLYLYTDSWMVANALWGWLQQWKKTNWQRRGKPIWAAALWQDIAARVENMAVKVRHVDAHIPKSRATEEHQNNEQVDKAAKIEVAQVDLDWECKGELFIGRWAHETSGHLGRDATYRWARDRGVDLTMEAITQVTHECEICAAIKRATRVKSPWNRGRWLGFRYGEAWQIDYIGPLPRTRQGKRYILTMVEVTTGWLETFPGNHATARNTILGLERQILW